MSRVELLVIQYYNQYIGYEKFDGTRTGRYQDPIGPKLLICYSGDTGRRNFNHQLLINLLDSKMEIAKNIIKNGQTI